MTAGSPLVRGRRLPKGLRALGHRNYRLFSIGQLISLIGTWMQSVAQGWLVLQLTHDPLTLGALAAVQFMPVMVLGLFGGVVADAVPKRLALVVTQTSAGILALVLGLLAVTGTVQVWEVFVLAALLGLVNAFDMPIRQSFVVEMVGREDIVSAVALNSAVFNATRIIGPAVAGILIAIVGIAACFLINAASYIAVVAGLLMMRPSDLRPPPVSALQRTARSVISQLAEGLRYVRNTPIILLAIFVVGLVSTAALNFQVLLPLLAQDVLNGDATTYGFLSASAGVGSLIGALVLAFGRLPTTRRLLVGAAVIGLAMLGLAVSRSVVLSMALMATIGWGTIAMSATTNTIIQLTAPDHLRGRVMSVYTTVFAGSTPIGGLLTGAVAGSAGTPAALAAGGLVSLAAVVLALAWAVTGTRRDSGLVGRATVAVAVPSDGDPGLGSAPPARGQGH